MQKAIPSTATAVNSMNTSSNDEISLNLHINYFGFRMEYLSVRLYSVHQLNVSVCVCFSVNIQSTSSDVRRMQRVGKKQIRKKNNPTKEMKGLILFATDACTEFVALPCTGTPQSTKQWKKTASNISVQHNFIKFIIVFRSILNFNDDFAASRTYIFVRQLRQGVLAIEPFVSAFAIPQR